MDAGEASPRRSRFLFTRGLWLILIEFTVVRIRLELRSRAFGDTLARGVIWVIGASMVALGGSCLAAALGHRGPGARHDRRPQPVRWISSREFSAGQRRYGTCCTSRAFRSPDRRGPLLCALPADPVGRRDGRGLRARPGDGAWTRGAEAPPAQLGAAITIGFVLLRATNLYGDPAPWSVQATWLATFLSFLNCEKYPPSLLFLMMTLGPALMLLGAFEHARGAFARLSCDVRRGAVLLLCRAHLSDPRARGRRRLCHDRRPRDAIPRSGLASPASISSG